MTFDFVLGSGYDNPAVQSVPECGIEVSRNVLRMSDHMRKADMALSSQGRTTFELACMGVPTIVLAENEREQLHTFAQMDNGFINLGLGSEVSDEDLASTIAWLAGARSVRREMRKLMLEMCIRDSLSSWWCLRVMTTVRFPRSCAILLGIRVRTNTALS